MKTGYGISLNGERDMLVRLTSSTSGEVVMLAEHLRGLLEVLDKDCTARGIFTLEQLPPTIAKLKTLVEADRQAAHLYEQAKIQAENQAGKMAGEAAENEVEEEAEDDEKSDETPIWLGQRAVPLLHLMERTLREKGFILWQADRDF